MFKLKSIKFKKINSILKRLLEALAKRSFLTFLGLFFLSLLLALAIFYYYFIFLVENSNLIFKKEQLFQLDVKSQQNVLEEWQRRNEIFQTADFKEYPDFFNVDRE